MKKQARNHVNRKLSESDEAPAKPTGRRIPRGRGIWRMWLPRWWWRRSWSLTQSGMTVLFAGFVDLTTVLR